MAKERIGWIDASRGLAFLMVIYSHLPMMNPEIMKWFSPVFLTTFFFVSGYLFKSGAPFSVVFEQRTRTILLPFVILGLVMIGLNHVASFNEHGSLLDEVKGLVMQNGVNQILWFVAALYVYSLLFYWVDRWCRTTKRLLWLCVCLFAINCISYHWLGVSRLPWHVDSAGFACLYMCLGKCYRLYEERVDRTLSGVWLWVAAGVYLTAVYLMSRMYSHHGSPYVIDSMLVTLAGLMLIIYASKRLLHHSRFLLFVGANTLFYFAFHGKVYSAILAVTHKVAPAYISGHDFWTDAWVALMVVFADAMILILPAMAVNRYTPWTLGKGFRLWGPAQRNKPA